MILKKAGTKAIKYAILKFHYSKSVPCVQCAYSVFEGEKWCGVICYSVGANNAIAKPYNLKQGQVIELVRVALNGLQSSTTKALALSLRLLKKDCPMVKMVVSYADTEQKHKGTIYQATNWYYTGEIKSSVPIVNGKKVHKRTFSSKYGSYAGVKLHKTKPKHKYIYPLTKDMRELCKKLAKPYPK